MVKIIVFNKKSGQTMMVINTYMYSDKSQKIS